ncbi:glycosyltransferase family 2 protein [Porticoccus sp.]
MKNFKISIVTPFYNEADSINLFFESIWNILNNSNFSYEIICIDDGSSDNTLEILKKFAHNNPDIKIISLSRNFGKEYALTAGIDAAQGDAVIPIDADLQDPPELIPSMVEEWIKGFPIVLAKRASRTTDTTFKRGTAHFFYKVINILSDVSIPENTGDFRLLDRSVVEALKTLPERTRFMKGLFAWIGFDHTTVYYDRQNRREGKTKWNVWKLWNFALDGIFSFSTTPIRIWTYLGLTIALASSLYGLSIIIKTLVYGISSPGYASLACLILFFSGINLVGIGLLGEYIGRIFIETKCRPLYIIKEKIGFQEET